MTDTTKPNGDRDVSPTARPPWTAITARTGGITLRRP